LALGLSQSAKHAPFGDKSFNSVAKGFDVRD